MKRIPIIKFILGLVTVGIFMLALKSCKKVDNSSPTDPETSKAKIIKAIKAKYGGEGFGIIYPVHKTSTRIFYKNSDGKMVDLYGKNASPNGTQSPCFNCSTATTVGQLKVITTLNYVKRWYRCESYLESSLIVDWTISLPFAAKASSVDSSYGTWGYVEIFAPGGGAPVGGTSHYGYQADFVIKDLGYDPTCSLNRMYEVSYQTDNIPDSYFGSGSDIECEINIEGTCSLLGGVVNTGLVGAGSPSDDSYLPCNRVDIAFVVPNTGPGNCATAVGCYNACTNPGGFAVADSQEVEYRPVTSLYSSEWDDQTGSTVYWGTVSGTPTSTMSASTGILDLINMTTGSGTWLVRYRNIKNSSCNSIYSTGFNPSPGPPYANGNWLSQFKWVTEIWPL